MNGRAADKTNPSTDPSEGTAMIRNALTGEPKAEPATPIPAR